MLNIQQQNIEIISNKIRKRYFNERKTIYIQQIKSLNILHIFYKDNFRFFVGILSKIMYSAIIVII